MRKNTILLAVVLMSISLGTSAVKYESQTTISEPSISGDGKMEASDYAYIKSVSSALEAVWQPPEPKQYPKDIYKQFKKKQLSDLEAVAEFTITPEGQVEDLKLKEASALPLFNESCLKAVRDAAPYPEPGKSKIIEYQFEYHYTHKNFWQRFGY